MKLEEITCCLITGASSGIGEALAKELSRRGVRLLLTGRDAEKLKALQCAFPSDIFPGDLKDPLALQGLLEWVDEKNPNLQIHNAGFGLYGPFEGLTDQEVIDMVQVNCTAAALGTKRALDRWNRRKEKGVVLNVGSVLSHIPFPFSALYSATKAFIRHLSIALSGEQLGQAKILVSCPGRVVTAFQERARRGEKKVILQKGMPVEKAVSSIIRQIEKEKREVIFDWRYALLATLTRVIFPTSFTQWMARFSQKRPSL